MTRLNLIGLLRSARAFFGVALVSALALLGSPFHVLAEAESSNSELEAFSRRLETDLNSSAGSLFDAVVSDLQSPLVQRYQRFRQDFPGVTWRVEPAAPLKDGRLLAVAH